MLMTMSVRTLAIYVGVCVDDFEDVDVGVAILMLVLLKMLSLVSVSPLKLM